MCCPLREVLVCLLRWLLFSFFCFLLARSSCTAPRGAIALHQNDPGDGLHAGTKHSRARLDPRHARETPGVVGLLFLLLSVSLPRLGFPFRSVSFRFVSLLSLVPFSAFPSKAGITASPALHYLGCGIGPPHSERPMCCPQSERRSGLLTN